MLFFIMTEMGGFFRKQDWSDGYYYSHPVRLFWNLAYADAYAEMLWEKNIVPWPKSSSSEHGTIGNKSLLNWWLGLSFFFENF